MKVAFATPELHTLVRRTGLAEFAEHLPRTLMQQGHEVLVFVPWTIDVEDVRVLGLREVATLRVKDGEGLAVVKLHRGHVRDLPVVLVDHSLFRERHPYGDERGPYLDNWRRYALFTRAVLDGLLALGFVPDVVHGFDWTTGLMPLIKQLEYSGKGHALDKTATFFGIHNLAMQGPFEREVLPKIGIPLHYFRFTEGIELSARVNFLKAGAEFATLVGASSPTMAERLRTLNRGDGLEDTFQRRDDELIGIRGGIDYRTWDPSNDPLLAQTYSAQQPDPSAGKRKCKSTLQDAMKLDNNPKKPLVAILSRFDTDGGFDVLAEALTPMLEREITLIMMGPGAPEILDRIRTLEQTFAGNCKLIEGYNVNMAHTVLGAADALLLPGHYHASTALCAIALRYGVTPIAYAQSGLEDLITDLEAAPETGTGFLFEAYQPDALVAGIDAMRGLYKKATEWRAAVKRCMELDFSWQECGREYDNAYKRAVRLATGQEKRKKRKPKRVVTAPEPEPPRPKRIHPNLPTSFEGLDEEEAGQVALVRRIVPGQPNNDDAREEKRANKAETKADTKKAASKADAASKDSAGPKESAGQKKGADEAPADKAAKAGDKAKAPKKASPAEKGVETGSEKGPEKGSEKGSEKGDDGGAKAAKKNSEKGPEKGKAKPSTKAEKAKDPEPKAAKKPSKKK